MKTRILTVCVVGLLIAPAALGVRGEQPARSDAHEAYAESLWAFLQETGYQDWKLFEPETDFAFGPPSCDGAKHYANHAAATSLPHREGSIVVTEHYASDPPALATITVRLKRRAGFDAKNDDWYWVHFTPDGKTIKTSADKDQRAKRGFAVFEEDGRLWVFDTGSSELSKYLQAGELAKHVIRPGVGPAGVTLKAPDADTITRYLAAKPGFVTILEDGRLWVFRENAVELVQFGKAGELAKHVIRPGAGPDGLTLKAPDVETLDAYLRASGS